MEVERMKNCANICPMCLHTYKVYYVLGAAAVAMAETVAAAKTLVAVAVEIVVSLAAENIVAMTRQGQTTLAMLGACNKQPIAAAGMVVMPAVVDTVAGVAETLAVAMPVAALFQCNSRDRFY